MKAQLFVACAAALLATHGALADTNLRADAQTPPVCKYGVWKYGLCDSATGKLTKTRLFVSGNRASCTALSETVDCDVDCVMDWEPWTAANNQCNPATGLRTRKQVQAVAPRNNGLPCAVAQTQSEVCAVDCSMGWQPWSDCNKATGLQTRTEKVLVPAKNGGVPCAGARTETQTCNVDCEMYFPPWDWATHTCSKGTHKRTRSQVVKVEKKNDGAACSPLPDESIDCDVDCELGYPAWSTNPSDCDPQTGLLERTQVEVIAKFGDGAVCPTAETEYRKCPVNCVATFGDWSTCDKNTGTQSRTEYISVQAKNGGTACSALQSETRKCDVACEMKFPDWDPLVHQCNKATGQRVRFEQPFVLPKNNAAACPAPKRDVMECPVSCELKLPDWSAVLHPCDTATGLQTRTQVVAVTAKNGGSPCPPAQSESRKCTTNCVLDYPDWATTTCNKATGLQTRTQYQVTAPKNGGTACPAAQTQTQPCDVDCEVKFPDWDPTIHLCSKTTGLRTRTEIVDVTKKNGGKVCPAVLATDVLACPVDCELAWPAWNATMHVCDKATGLRTRTQIPSVLPKNGGLNCPIPQTETQKCPVDCETAFPDWNSIPCKTSNTKTRAQYPIVSAKNGGAECVFKTPEVMVCEYINIGFGNSINGFGLGSPINGLGNSFGLGGLFGPGINNDD